MMFGLLSCLHQPVAIDLKDLAVLFDLKIHVFRNHGKTIKSLYMTEVQLAII